MIQCNDSMRRPPSGGLAANIEVTYCTLRAAVMIAAATSAGFDSIAT